MNFTPLNLFNFQPIGKDDSRKRGKNEIAIRAQRIDLAKTTYAALGYPEAIQIGTDGHYLAIWAEEEAFPVSNSRGASSATINGSGNVRRLQSRLEKLGTVDFKTHYVILSEPIEEDGKLIYDIDNLHVCARQARRSA